MGSGGKKKNFIEKGVSDIGKKAKGVGDNLKKKGGISASNPIFTATTLPDVELDPTKIAAKQIKNIQKAQADKQSTLINQQEKFLDEQQSKIDLEKQAELDAQKEAELQNLKDEERRSARLRQKIKTRGFSGRSSTILTGGQNLGDSSGARKTLLGQ